MLTDEEADALGVDTLAALGLSTIHITTETYTDLFGLDRADWHVVLSDGEITFTTPTRRAVARVQVIGTLDPADDTWLWGWDHPSIPEPCAAAAGRVRAFGERNGLAYLTDRKVTCSQEDAWHYTSLAVRLGEETCAYRGPTDGPFVFMTFGAITVTGLA
jgi:hypothetical protein